MISFASAVGNLFNRLGKLGLTIKTLKSTQTTLLGNYTDTVNGVVAQYNAESDLQAVMGNSYIGLLNGVADGNGALMQQLAELTANRIVYRDNPRLGQNLTSQSNLASLQEIIRQMRLEGATVLNMTITAVPQASAGPPGPTFTGTGNGTIVTSVRRPLDGLVLENSFAENLLFTCTGDSYSGRATAGNEPFTVTGVGNQSDFWAFDWPLGSNAQTGLNAINGEANNGQGNLLNNGGWEVWTAGGIPNNWLLDVGTPGLNPVKETGIVYTGTASLNIVGDSATLVQLRQQFAGVTGSLSPLTQYAINLYARRAGVAVTTGVLTVDLVDQNNVLVNDQNGIPNSFTCNLTTTTTVGWIAFNGVFRTPEILPAATFLRLRTTTPVNTGANVYLDTLAMGPMTQVYSGGPFVAVFSGSIPFAINDYGTVTVTNSRGAGGTLSTFQTLCYRLFTEIGGNELLLPSSSTPTISDGLIG